MTSDSAREIGEPDNLDSIRGDFLIPHSAFHVPTRLNSRINDHATRTHFTHHFSGDDDRRPSSKILRRRDHDVGQGDMLSHELPLLFQLLRRQRFSIPARSLTGLTQIEFYKLRSQRFHLILHYGSGIKSFHPSS